MFVGDGERRIGGSMGGGEARKRKERKKEEIYKVGRGSIWLGQDEVRTDR